MCRAAVLSLAAAAALAAGCGSSTDGEQATAPAAATSAAITIAAPADGGRLKARAVKDGVLRASVRVSGTARPGATVHLSAGCRPEPCQASAMAAGDGDWAATMTLRTPRAATFVTIDANAQRNVVAAGSSVVTVELVGPPLARPKREADGERESGSGATSTQSAPAPSAGTATIPAPSRRTLPHDVLLLGDSLALGIAAPLQAALPGWRVQTDGRIGRPLSEGMQILGRQSSPPAVIAFSLFTNDDPRNTRALESAVRATASRDGSCVVWSTVVRPPLNGVSYAAANNVLARLAGDPRLAPGLQLVDWAAEVAQSPSLVSPKDGVHGTPTGYRVLAQLYAAAIRSCAGG